jgi:carboxyl-terminal processing protease
MIQQWSILGISAIATALMVITPSRAELIDEVGQTVTRSVIEGTFNDQDEPAVAQDYQSFFEESPKELVDEVWQILDRQYVDGTFNGQDWQAVRQDYLNRSYESQAEAYNAIREMLELLDDPFTWFMSPEEFKSMQIDSNGDSVGVGLLLKQDHTTQEFILVHPIEATPAYDAGILPGDVLVKIDRENTQGMSLREVNHLLQGRVGTSVILTVRRDQRELEFEVTREPIEIHPVRYTYRNTPTGGIGYIRLNQFSRIAAQEMREAINDLETQQVNGYILDLRSNPGGLINSCIEIARMWLDKGKIVSTVSRRGNSNENMAKNQALTDKPLVVLVNEGSAAASEILAAALQDNQRGVLVGTSTAGYNSVQSVRVLSDGSGLAVTLAKYLTPNGRDISQVGVTPDQVVSLTTAQQTVMIREGSAATMNDPQYVQAVEMLTQLIQN